MGFMYEFPHSKEFDSDLREIIELFIQLKGLPVRMDELEKFVKNYFSNLDVQSEINKKLDDMNADGTLDRIINEEIFGELNNKLNINAQSVNVKAFGAKGDGVTNDVDAVDRAIAYAEANNIRSLYFPDGTYLLPNKTYVIDTSKMRWFGENVTKLKSTGLANGNVFITLTSPLALAMYDYARVPLADICIDGEYFTDSTTNTVTAISYGNASNPGATMVSPHLALYNVTVKNFGTAIYLASSYKSSAYNLNIIACNYGLYIGDGGIVPWNVYCIHVECCNTAIYSLADGYAEARYFGGAFEYNRTVFSGYGKHTFFGVKFEMDMRAACNESLVSRPVFNMSSPSTGYIKFEECSFLLLPNYPLNVTYWVPNPYITEEITQPLIFAYSGTYYGKAQVMLNNCEIATEQLPTEIYLITAQKLLSKNNTYLGPERDIIPSAAIVHENEVGFIV